jgi:hypothetical protein
MLREMLINWVKQEFPNAKVDVTDNHISIVINDDKRVKDYASLVGSLDVCLFSEFIEELGNILCLKQFTELVENHENLDDEQNEILDNYISQALTVLNKVIEDRISDLEDIQDKIANM